MATIKSTLGVFLYSTDNYDALNTCKALGEALRKLRDE